MISLNATIFVQVTLFLVLLFILNRLMIQPLHRLILQREAAVEEKEAALDRLSSELEQMAEAYQKRLRAAETDAQAARAASSCAALISACASSNAGTFNPCTCRACNSRSSRK